MDPAFETGSAIGRASVPSRLVMPSKRGSHSRESSPAGSRRTTRHNGSLADNVCADELPGTRGGHARRQSIESARASSGQLSEAESRAALPVDYAVV